MGRRGRHIIYICVYNYININIHKYNYLSAPGAGLTLMADILQSEHNYF